MARVLYISYTGLGDPLGQSQVLQYLLRLARDHRITLLTFEKTAALRDAARMQALQDQCYAAGIVWRRLTYHRRPGIPATLYDIAIGAAVAVRLARRHAVQIVHARSYIAGMMALAVKRRTGARYIFDMRGFWPDERVDGGIWKKDSVRYRFFKRVERALFLSADYIVSLTRAGAREFTQFDYLRGCGSPFSVIPTCTNLDVFRPMESPGSGGFVLGYVGSAGSWYMFDDVARAVRLLFDERPDSRFLVVNNNDHEPIRAALSAQGVDLDRVTVLAAPYAEVGRQIGRMSAGIFFIKPVFSKRASCPTRMGEFLACGKPCLANAGVGDVQEDLEETRTGAVISEFSDASLQDGLGRLLALAADPDVAARCRATAEARFSLGGGVASYDAMYRELGPS